MKVARDIRGSEGYRQKCYHRLKRESVPFGRLIYYFRGSATSVFRVDIVY
jgi:hypothetical protein